MGISLGYFHRRRAFVGAVTADLALVFCRYEDL